MSLHALISKDGFRLRGTEMSRIDGFSDVVFGFALTLLVVSLEVPKRYAELHEAIVGCVPFIACFTLFFMLWWSHFRFFRRYGLHDAATIVINAFLLLIVLIYVYPMKFLMTLFVSEIMNRPGADRVFDSQGQVRELMMFYSVGFAAIYLCFALLYWNGWRQRRELDLNRTERALTWVYIWDNVGVASIGVLSCVLAMTLPERIAGAAGYAFFLIGVWKTVHGAVSGNYLRRINASGEQAN